VLAAVVASSVVPHHAVRADAPIAKVRMAHQGASTIYLTYYIARDLGWYKDWGLQIEDQIVASDSALSASLIAGDSDIASTGPLNVYNAIARGADLKAIGAGQVTPDYVIVAKQQIHSLRDLAGKSFATSGPSGLPQALPKMLFKAEGIDEAGTAYLAVGSHAARLQAVVAGKVDAAAVDVITAEKGLKSGIHVVTTVHDHFPLLAYTYLTVPGPSLKDPQKRLGYEIFMRGVIMAARLAMESPQKAAEVLQAYYPGTTVAELESVVKQLDAMNVWPVNGGIDPAITAYTTKLEFEAGEAAAPLAPERVLDPGIVEAVLKQVGTFPLASTASTSQKQ
jgi:NitT/TauT family transport system substrate-binding protein